MKTQISFIRNSSALSGFALFALACSGFAQAQLSGSGDQLLVVGVSNLRGDPAANFGGDGIKTGDLNCDGRDEIIVLQPSASVTGIGSAGTLTVIPTTATTTPDPALSFEWNQATAGVSGAPELNDRYASSADVFDFDKDGCDDLFVGVPNEDLTVNDVALVDAGGVQAFRGNAQSVLTATASEFLSSSPERATAFFGTAVAAMSFGPSSFTHKLTVSAPNENFGSVLTNVGSIEKFAGAPDCFICDNQVTFSMAQLVPGLSANDRYGTEMQAFGVGIARRFLAFRGSGANALSIVRNLDAGPLSGSVFRRSNLVPTASNSAPFAALFIAGEFDGSLDDIALLADDGNGGAPFEIFVIEAGALTGFAQTQRIPGPLFAGNEFLFISAMATGDFNGDGFGDLALGFPGIDSLTSTAGNVLILRGSANGLMANNPQRIQQGSNGIAGSPNDGEFFGRSLTAGDFNGDGIDDLVVGVPGETFQGQLRGGVHLIYGAASPQIFVNGFE
jgi:FG-GAP repeat